MKITAINFKSGENIFLNRNQKLPRKLKKKYKKYSKILNKNNSYLFLKNAIESIET